MFRVRQFRAARDGLGARILRHHDLLIRLAIAILVRAIPQHRRSAHQRAIADGQDRAGHDELIEEDLALIKPSVAVSVGEDHDPAHRLILAVAVNVRHVTTHLHHPEPTIRTKLRKDRIAHQRLTRRQFHPVARCHLEAFQFLLRRQSPRVRNQLRRHQRRRHLHPCAPFWAKTVETANKTGRARIRERDMRGNSSVAANAAFAIRPCTR
jgi:hypothetical protein